MEVYTKLWQYCSTAHKAIKEGWVQVVQGSRGGISTVEAGYGASSSTGTSGLLQIILC